MDVISYTADRAVTQFEAWELYLILAAARWVLDRLGTGCYGRDELHSVMRIWMEDAQESVMKMGQLSADEPVELRALDMVAPTTSDFRGEAVFRYLARGVIPDDAEFERLMGVEVGRGQDAGRPT